MTEPLLTAEEEVELGFAIEAGVLAAEALARGVHDPTRARDLRILAREGQAAFHRFVAANVRLAAWMARRRLAARANATLEFDDLLSEGVLGLIRAVHKWDYRLGWKFSTYATYWVSSFQQRAVRRASAATLTFADHDDLDALFSARDRLIPALHREPTIAELAEDVGSTRRRVLELLDMSRRADSLDRPVARGTREPSTLANLLPAPTGNQDSATGHVVSQLVAELGPRERAVVIDLFGLHDGVTRTPAEVAALRRVPVELVERTAAAALERLRQHAAGNGWAVAA